ncbi:MAG: hypothetical protein Q4E55_08955 [Bacteroidales bacterium]|nr:hypothetical protein [Bacteroidales bacterium]
MFSFTCLSAGVLVLFLNQIKEWAEVVFKSISSKVKKAWVYICRIPGGIKQMLRYIFEGVMYETIQSKPVDMKTIENMYKDKILSKEEYEQLTAGQELRVLDVVRD